MNHDEKSQFGKVISRLADFYGKKVTPIFLAMYWEVLSRYTMEELEWAVRCHVADPDTGQFMPKPADFIRHLDGSSHDKSLNAWTKVLAAARNIGAYDSVVFDDPLIHHVLSEMGGWVTLCHSADSKLPFLFQEFSQRYAASLKSKPKVIPKKLNGIHCLPHPRIIFKDV